MFSIIGADGKEYGPVPLSKVQEWIAGGRANLQTRARRGGDTEWKTLGDFPEFGGVPTPPVSDPSVPPADPAAVAAAPVAPVVPPAPAAAAEPAVALASPWIRLGAALLDSIVAMFVLGPGFVMFGLSGAFNPTPTPNTPMLIAAVGVMALGFLVLLAVQIYLLVTRGQTIGKKLVKIKIVTLDTGENPGFVKTVLLRSFVNGLIGAVPFIGGVYSLVDVLFIFRDDHRCIHDLLAGTIVVQA